VCRRPTPKEHPLEAFIGKEVERGTQSLYAHTIALVERILLTRVLRDTSGNQSHAARILGIARGSLRNKLREHGIHIHSTPSISVESEQGETEAPVCASEP
jgi:DNA-binding NtrC family response regulator